MLKTATIVYVSEPFGHYTSCSHLSGSPSRWDLMCASTHSLRDHISAAHDLGRIHFRTDKWTCSNETTSCPSGSLRWRLPETLRYVKCGTLISFSRTSPTSPGDGDALLDDCWFLHCVEIHPHSREWIPKSNAEIKSVMVKQLRTTLLQRWSENILCQQERHASVQTSELVWAFVWKTKRTAAHYQHGHRTDTVRLAVL